MSKTWVVVAESSRARIFATSGPRAGLEELTALTHPDSRLKESELISDSPGRSFDSAGAGRHAMGSGSDQKHHEAELFARIIASHLSEAQQQHRFEKLILVAPPEFLGLLRKQLTQSCADQVVATCNKNLVQQDPVHIRNHLPEWF